ncbi:hypothetical protein CS369_12615 [Candidatus Symbiopectobacterium sp. 'North America']|nr:hypothetical protein [Candidatus Symbiopectobacterium sp. 'North America']
MGDVDAESILLENANNLEFDASFLNVDNAALLDLSRFAAGASVLPGVYKTAVYINDQWVNNVDVEFKAHTDKTVYPCLSIDLIKSIAFNYYKLPSDFFSSQTLGDQCVDLSQQLPDAQINYDSNEQRLDIVIPQIYMQNTARGTVSPALWDDGIAALLMGYNVNGYTSESQGKTFNSLFAGLNACLNVGPWYLRHNGAYTHMDNAPSKYSSINTYLQRDIPTLKARMLVGQSNTVGQLFDTLPFTGAQLMTDERMLPESQRSYAPEIRGIARTNARVTVRQGGQVLYETTVSPGEFLINDLYPTGYGGDLNVTVRESDRTEQNFSVPYASVAQLLRPGSSRYAITGGEVRSDNLRDKPSLYQATYQRGLTNAITGYGGVQASENYSAVLQNYWNETSSEKQYQMGYNNRYKNLSYGVSVNRSFSSVGSEQTNYLLSFSMPLGRNDDSHTPYLRMDLSHDSSGRYGQQASVSGAVGTDNPLSYAVTAMHANQNRGSSGSVSGNYRNAATALSGAYSTGKGYHCVSAGMNGTVIGHAGGVTFTPYASDTFALVEAKGAEGASVSSYPGVSIDSRGYAVLLYLSPYQMNEINIDPKGASANLELELELELDSTSMKVAPHSGAVVKVKYNAKSGTPILVNATYQGEPVPFGADIFDSQGNNVGAVGQGGQLYARVSQDKGQLRVKWGEDPDMSCTVGYLLMPMAKGKEQRQIQQFNSVCKSAVASA